MLNILRSKLLFPRCVAFAFALCLLPVSAIAADNWIEVRSPHFIVNSNAGETEARKVADQFEQIREMFHSAFSGLRVDPPQPIVIIAAKNENTVKLFLPEFWDVKGHLHPAGLYQPGEDKDYVVVRMDSEGENPFHAIYHEYTHALLHLNFANLPAWLDEGLAEFFGNSTLGDKESKIGTIDRGTLYLLNQSKLIPIETLMQVDHDSPYYNEANRASIFYAESWAVVHYLMMDKDARQRQLEKNFLAAWEKSGNQLEAAREAFGDLKQFGKVIESYASQYSFQIGLFRAGQEIANKDYVVRGVSPGEALALRGDFFTHHNRVDQAQPLLEDAVKIEPNLPFAHEALGYCHYRQNELEEADKEFVEAIKLGASGFAPPYFHGILLTRSGRLSAEEEQEAQNSLEKAVQLNPQFAPGYEGLSQAYWRLPATQKQAIDAAIKATRLDPGQDGYAINLAYLLLNNGKSAEARDIAQQVFAGTTSPAEKEVVNRLLQRIQREEEWAAKRQADSAAPSVQSDESSRLTTSTRPAGTTGQEGAQGSPVELKQRLYGGDGRIGKVECSKKPEFTISIEFPSGPISFHAADFGKVTVTWADDVPEPSLATCERWKGRQVKVWFLPAPGKGYSGEISRLYFY